MLRSKNSYFEYEEGLDKISDRQTDAKPLKNKN